MIVLDPTQCATLRHWFEPETPGAGAIGPHCLITGHGRWMADRRSDPRLILAGVGDNFALRGDPAAFPTGDPPPLMGFVDAGPAFQPVLEQAYGEVYHWSRLLYRLDRAPQDSPIVTDALIRPLQGADADQIAGFAPDTAWISNTWEGPAGLAGSGYAWGAFVGGVLASLACSFFVGETVEDVGVVTEAPYRGRGLNTACCVAMCLDIQSRGHTPTWSTSPDNGASIRVAEKLGFTFAGPSHLYIVNMPWTGA